MCVCVSVCVRTVAQLCPTAGPLAALGLWFSRVQGVPFLPGAEHSGPLSCYEHYLYNSLEALIQTTEPEPSGKQTSVLENFIPALTYSTPLPFITARHIIVLTPVC